MDSQDHSADRDRSAAQPRKPLDVTDGVAGDVPVFSCVIYVCTTEKGVRARVANLPDLECESAGEREALGQLIPAFKRQVAEYMEAGREIPWIDPVPPPREGERQRFVPVHL